MVLIFVAKTICGAIAKLNINYEVKQDVKAQALNTKDGKGKLSTV
jgi:hypothetical protein